MATWKRWDKYEDVPRSLLEREYTNKERVKARDPEYLDLLNQIYNPMPASMRAQTKKGIPCFTCPARLTPAEAERGRLCTTCEAKVRKAGTAHISNGWCVSAPKGA